MSAKLWLLNSLKIIPDFEVNQGLVKLTINVLTEADREDQIPDKVVEQISKYVEVAFRNSIEEFSKQKLDENITGWDLVVAAIEKGLFRKAGREDFMLRWYFKDIRNPSHHTFYTSSKSTFLAYFLISNHILQQFKVWSKRPLLIWMDLKTEKDDYNTGEIITFTAIIPRPDGKLVQDGEVKAKVHYSNKFSQVQTMNYMPANQSWQTQISTSGGAPGIFEISVSVEGDEEKYESRNPLKRSLKPK